MSSIPSLLPNISSNEQVHQPGGFFQSSHALINGGHFVLNNSIVQGGPSTQGVFDLLRGYVALSAFNDAEQQVDVPRCHPKTREAVRNKILDWVQQESNRTEWLLWLNGAAGAGKSAIAQSIAEMCAERGVLAASFFFFRGDPTRNTIKPLVATLVYQLILLLPPIHEFITQIFNANPLILGQSLDTQFKKLIVEPLQQMQLQSQLKSKVLLIIDGVDECDGEDKQTHLIHMLSGLMALHTLPIIVLIGSRAENHLKAAFAARKTSALLLRLPLDGDHYLPDQDIGLFIEDRLADIKETHPFSHLLAPDWPSVQLVRRLVANASGQFIYAAVAMRFISSSRMDPAAQADILLGLRRAHADAAAPLAELDALYRHILAQARDPDRMLGVLACAVLAHMTAPGDIAQYMGLRAGDVPVALADVASLVVCDVGARRVRFLHASLADFLMDDARAGAFGLRASGSGTRLALVGFRNAQAGTLSELHERTLVHFLGHATPTPELREAVLAYQPSVRVRTMHNFVFAEYLSAVRYLRTSNCQVGEISDLLSH